MTTLTLLKAMAAPAITGLSSPSAAATAGITAPGSVSGPYYPSIRNLR